MRRRNVVPEGSNEGSGYSGKMGDQHLGWNGDGAFPGIDIRLPVKVSWEYNLLLNIEKVIGTCSLRVSS